MKHQNLIVPDEYDHVTTIRSILERGHSSDLIRLFYRLRQQPFSELADLALEAARTSEIYGYPQMIEACLLKWRSDDTDRQEIGPDD